jgi:hypothetical protein
MQKCCYFLAEFIFTFGEVYFSPQISDFSKKRDLNPPPHGDTKVGLAKKDNFRSITAKNADQK